MGKDNIMFHSLLFPSTLISTSLNKNYLEYNLVHKLCVT
jgi:methionyl-tRNA synthetase